MTNRIPIVIVSFINVSYWILIIDRYTTDSSGDKVYAVHAFGTFLILLLNAIALFIFHRKKWPSQNIIACFIITELIGLFVLPFVFP